MCKKFIAIIENKSFLKKMTLMRYILNPIMLALNITDRKNCLLSEAFQAWSVMDYKINAMNLKLLKKHGIKHIITNDNTQNTFEKIDSNFEAETYNESENKSKSKNESEFI